MSLSCAKSLALRGLAKDCLNSSLPARAWLTFELKTEFLLLLGVLIDIFRADFLGEIMMS